MRKLTPSKLSDLNLNLNFDKSGKLRLTLLNDFSIVIPAFADNKATKAVYNEEVICILKKGSSNNLGTVPWFLRWIVSPTDPVIALPSIIHDGLVNEFGDAELEFYFKDGTRYEGEVTWKMAANAMLKLMLLKKGTVNYIKSRAAYVGIRAYGYLKGL